MIVLGKIQVKTGWSGGNYDLYFTIRCTKRHMYLSSLTII